MTPSPRRSSGSKRNDPDQAAGTWYLTRQQRDDLQWAANTSKVSGEPLDQSDILQAALEAYLPDLLTKLAALAQQAAHERPMS